jgi:hypothetical protein
MCICLLWMFEWLGAIVKAPVYFMLLILRLRKWVLAKIDYLVQIVLIISFVKHKEDFKFHKLFRRGISN